MPASKECSDVNCEGNDELFNSNFTFCPYCGEELQDFIPDGDTDDDDDLDEEEPVI